VADCLTFCLKVLFFSAGTRFSLLEPEKMGNFGLFLGNFGKNWSFSVENGRFWPLSVPGKVA
jgi:hypothetical protein